MRYTPAGFPALNMVLSHVGTISDSGVFRQTQVIVSAVATGILAESLAKQPLGSEFVFTGFVSRAKQNSNAKATLHVQDFVKPDVIDALN